MTEDEKKELIYLAMKDIYKEFNHSVNNLIILREFLTDIYIFGEKKETLNFAYPSIEKLKNKH